MRRGDWRVGSLLASIAAVALLLTGLAPVSVDAQVKGIERGGGFDKPYVPPRKRVAVRAATPRPRQPVRRTNPTTPDPEPEPEPELAVAVVPAEAIQRYESGRAAYDRNDFTKAIDEFEAAIRLDSKYIDAIIDLGDVYFDNANLEDAIEQYRRALVVDKDNFDAQYRLGRAAFARRDYDTALEAYQAVIKKNPSDPQAVYNLALTLKALKRFEQAIPHFEKAIALRGTSFPEARVNLARSLYEAERLDDSEAQARKAIEELGADHPDSASAYYSVATAKAKRGDLIGAADALKQAIAVCKGCSNDLISKFYYPLAQIYESRGERELAADAYEKFLVLAPFVPEYQIEDIRARISKLRAAAM